MKILLAVHDAKSAQELSRRLASQFKPDGTEVRLLHVLEEFPISLAEKMGSPEYPDYPAARGQLRRVADEFLERTSETLRSAGFRVSALLEEGDAQEIILDEAERWPAELIVVASHGRKGLRRFLLGGTAEAVARYAKCSVLIVRGLPLS